jgi:hypothetical protein
MGEYRSDAACSRWLTTEPGLQVSQLVKTGTKNWRLTVDRLRIQMLRPLRTVVQKRLGRRAPAEAEGEYYAHRQVGMHTDHT